MSLESLLTVRAALTKLSQSTAPPPTLPTSADHMLAYLFPGKFPTANKPAMGASSSVAAGATTAPSFQHPITGLDQLSDAASQAEQEDKVAEEAKSDED
jgi:hypothetical protein